MPRSNDSEDYEIPETWLNLDEITAPSPQPSQSNIQRGRRSYERPSGIPYVDEEDEEEERRPHTQPLPGSANNQSRPVSFQTDNNANIRDITELSVLPPIERPHHPIDLDDEGTENSTIWRSPRDRRAARVATQIYTVSYLILFSILGTLGRLGLQALNTYPGAPVIYGTIWANFAGSFLMGFLAEDRKLFADEYGKRRNRLSRTAKQPRRISPPESHNIGSDAEKDTDVGGGGDLSIPPQGQVRISQVGLAVTHPEAAMSYPPRRGRQGQSSFHPSSTRHDSPHSLSVTTYSRPPSAERRRHLTAKRSIPLFVGLATGFCGCLTSFAAFQRDAFLSLSNSPPANLNNTSRPTPRNGGYSFMAVLADLILTPGICLFALVAGAHLALALDPYIFTFSFSFTRRFLNRLAVVLAWGCWIGAVVMAIWPPDRPDPQTPVAYILPSVASWAQETWRGDAIFAVCFAPLGCLARFYLAMALNPRLRSFPLGTFVANVLAVLLLAGFYDLQRAPLQVLGSDSNTLNRLVGGGRVGCQVLQGMMDGFCGCLGALSIWVAELGGLGRRSAWFYGMTSVAVGVAAMVVVTGSFLWTIGFAEPACRALGRP